MRFDGSMVTVTRVPLKYNKYQGLNEELGDE
jgi:hypothetical protein